MSETEVISNRILKTELVKWRDLQWLQGSLKTLSKESFNKLKQSLRINNFIQPFNVWFNDKLWCLESRRWMWYAVPCKTEKEMIALMALSIKPIDTGNFSIPLPESWVVLDRRWDEERMILKYLIYSSSFESIPIGMMARIVISQS